jgi:hypothetical protein
MAFPPKKASPLDIANLFGDAADQKAKLPGKKSPKQVAAAKEQEKAMGKPVPKGPKKPLV